MKNSKTCFPAPAARSLGHTGRRCVRWAVVLFTFSAFLCTEENTGPVEVDEPKHVAWGAIEGTVVDQNGTPIRGVCVYSIPRRALVLTDSQGKFRLTRLGVDSVDYGLGLRRVGFADLDTFTGDSQSTPRLRVPIADSTISVGRITMESRGRSLSGRVMLSDGTPAAGAGVEIVSENRRVRTDPDGRFALAGLLSDTGSIIAAQSDKGWGTADYNLASEPGTPQVQITLSAGGAVIAGKVEDRNGAPLGRVRVQAVAGGLVDTTDSTDGSFRISDVPVGESIRLTSELGHVVERLIADSGGILTGIVLSDGHMVKRGRLAVGSVDVLTEGAPTPGRVTAFLDTLPVPAPDTGGSVDSGTTQDTSSTIVPDPETLIPDTVAYYVWDRGITGELDTITGSNFIEDYSLGNPVSYGAVTLDGDLIYGATIRAVQLPDSLAVQTPDTVLGISDTTVVLTGTAQSLRGGIARFSWDFDGDGTYDTTLGFSGSIEYRYNTAGTYSAVFLVESTANVRDSSVVTVIVSEPEPPEPESPDPVEENEE